MGTAVRPDLIPAIDFAAIWATLPAAVQADIGTRALREAFLRCVSQEFEGHVVYLADADRTRAEDDANDTAVEREALIAAALPDLFGSDPTPQRPNGSDPDWATPYLRDGHGALIPIARHGSATDTLAGA